MNKFTKDNNWSRRYLTYLGRVNTEPARTTNIKIAVWSAIWCSIDADIYDKLTKYLGFEKKSSEYQNLKLAYVGVGKSDAKVKFFKGKVFNELVDEVLINPYRYVSFLADAIKIIINENYTTSPTLEKDCINLQNLIQ